MDSKSLSHTRWKCQYHIVFIPKYRKKQLYGRLREDVRDVIKTLCSYKDVEIVEGAVCMDHVHLRMHPSKIKRIAVHGVPKGEKRPDDIR